MDGCGGWNRIGSGLVDEEFDGLRDGRCAPPTVWLEMLVLGKRKLVASDRLTSHQE